MGHDLPHSHRVGLDSAVEVSVVTALHSGVQYMSEVGRQALKAVAAHLPTPGSHSAGAQLVLDTGCTEAGDDPDFVFCSEGLGDGACDLSSSSGDQNFHLAS